MTTISAIIKKLREENHLKQRDVAKHLGISQQAYSYYELDKRELPSRYVIALANLYGVSTDFILCVDSNRTDPYDLNTDFVQGVPLRDVLINLEKLNPSNRETLIQYINSLYKPSSRKKPSKPKGKQ